MNNYSFVRQILQIADPVARFDTLSKQDLLSEYRNVVSLWAQDWAEKQGKVVALRQDNCGCPTVEAALRSGVIVLDDPTADAIATMPPQSEMVISLIHGAIERSYPEAVENLIYAQWRQEAIEGEFSTPLGIYGFRLKGNILGYGWRRKADRQEMQENFSTIIPPEFAELARSATNFELNFEAIALFLQSVLGIDGWVQILSLNLSATGELQGTFNSVDGIQGFEIAGGMLSISFPSRFDSEEMELDDWLVEAGINAASPQLQKWIKTLDKWVKAQNSFDSLQQVESAFDKLDTQNFARTLYEKRQIANLAGRVEVLEEDYE